MDCIETVEDTIKRFYSLGDNNAHYVLLQFQASSEAWSFVWPLLDPSKPYVVQFFAVSTLHSKISKQWGEIPESEYSNLKDKLLSLMTQPTTPKLIISELCEAFAVFLINIYGADNVNESERLVDQLTRIFPCNSPASTDLLLKILASVSLNVGKVFGAKKKRLRSQLGLTENLEGTNDWNKILWLLLQVFTSYNQNNSENSDDSLYSSALECTSNCLKLVPSLDMVEQLFPHLLTAAARFAPSSGNEFDTDQTWEAIEDCLIMMFTYDTLPKRPQLFWEWAKGIVSIAYEKGGTAFTSILTTLGESNGRTLLKALTENSDTMKKWTTDTLIELLLKCMEQPGRYPTDELQSSLVISFWFCLQDYLTTLDQPLENEAQLVLKPIYLRLARALLEKSKLPITADEAGSPDQRELFRRYRQDISDSFTYCYNVLENDLLILLGQRLTQPYLDMQKWTDVESTLYAIQSLPDSVGRQPNQYVLEILNLILSHISYERYPPEVLACACSTIGIYAEWLGENSTSLLEKTMHLITLGLTQGPITSTPASMALKDISRECQPHLAPLAPSILDVISKTLTMLPAGCGEGLRLMFSAGKLLNSLPTTEEQVKYLDSTLGLCIIKLRDLLQNPKNNTARIDIINQLKMSNMFLSTLEGAMGKSVLEVLFPIFNNIITSVDWNQDDDILEAMHHCAQRSLQCLLHPETDAKPLLPLLVLSYKTRPHPSALNLLRQIILLFGSDPENVMSPIFTEISNHTLGGISACKSVGGNLSDFSELLEAYFGLLSQICRKTPKLILQVPDNIPEMLKCAIMVLCLPENGVIKASASFIISVIRCNHPLKDMIEQFGQELVCMIFQCVGGRVATSILEVHALILTNLKFYFPSNISKWMQTALDEGILPLSPSQKEILIRNIMSKYLTKSRLNEILQEVSFQCHRPVVGV